MTICMTDARDVRSRCPDVCAENVYIHKGRVLKKDSIGTDCVPGAASAGVARWGKHARKICTIRIAKEARGESNSKCLRWQWGLVLRIGRTHTARLDCGPDRAKQSSPRHN